MIPQSKFTYPQVSEIGPPHDKTYEYQLKMGDLTSNGRGKNKKDAKTKAAENMVLKLEDLPKVVICKVSFNL